MGYLYLVLMRRIDAAYCCECRAFCGLCVRHTHSGEPCKTAEPIEMPFGAGSRVSKDARVCALNVGGPDWHNLANTIKRSARGGDAALKGKGYPFSIAERRVPELIPVLGSQPAGDVSYKSGGRLPLGPYFLPGLQLPLQPLKWLLPISVFGQQRHDAWV